MIRVATDEDADEVAAIYIDCRRRYVTFAPLVHTDEEIRVWVREVVNPRSREKGAAVADSALHFSAK